MEGDVETVWPVYIVAPINSEGSEVVVVSGTALCLADGNADQIFEMRLRRDFLNFALRSESDRKLVSEWFVDSCEKLSETESPPQ
jgi:hypothetical protein